MFTKSFVISLFINKIKTVSLLICLLLSGLATSLKSQTLVWQDNFDSATLNSNFWTYDFGDGCSRPASCGWGNSEQEYYTSRTQNVRIDSGNLVIEARKEAFGNSAFTSGRVKTEGRIHFMYGTLEARIKMPNSTNGLWPALWTLGTVGENWPQVGEIDIMELGAQAAILANQTNEHITGAMHWNNGGPQGDTVSSYNSPTDLSAGYHIYKLVWTDKLITMYIDSTLYFSFNIDPATTTNRTAFHTPHYLLMNLAVGGSYTGIYTAAGITAPLPGDMYVDYVKLYQNPGDSLYVGSQHAYTGNFGVFNASTIHCSDSLNYAKDASISYWNNLTNIPNAVPYDGQNVIAVEAAANNWFGMDIANRYLNLNNYDTGSIRFQFKSSYQGQYKFGLTTAFWQTWVNFPAGVEKYGLIRDGKWHQVIIPLQAFNVPDSGNNIDLMSIHDAFIFTGDAPANTTDFYIDDIYFSGGKVPKSQMNISISAPLNGAVLTSPTPVTINTSTSSNVNSVSFYDGSTLLYTSTIAPFNYTWINPAIGVDTLIAVATDSSGNTLTSNPVIIIVSNAGNIPPKDSITLPLNNATFITPASIVINATATDVGIGIYKVDFYENGVLLGTSTSSPYTFTWVDAPVGNYTLTVVATNTAGQSTTSASVNIVVINPVLPTVNITSPANNSSFLPLSTIVINASAAYSAGSITKVDFYNNNTLLGTSITSPYSFSWPNVPYGIDTLTAKATTNNGNTVVSTPVVINVVPAACTGIDASGDFSYSVYTYSGIVYYRFHPLASVIGSSSAIIYLTTTGSGTYPGYNMTASGGDFIYSATISTGTTTSFYFSYAVPSGGQRNSSTNPQSYVAGTVCVAGAPSVSITSPANAASFTAPATITIDANASDITDTVVKVDFYYGNTLIGSDSSSPYTINWTNVAAGSYNLTAVATGNNGLSTTSIPVSIIVNAPNTDGYCGTSFNKDYEYKASTTNGIVTFTFHPLNPILGCNAALIYVRPGTTGGYPGYNMTAVGTDFVYTQAIVNGTNVSFYFTYNVPTGGQRNSSANPQSYVVGTNCTGISLLPPTVTIVSPVNGASYTEPATIPVNVSATDVDTTIRVVYLYSGATLLDSANVGPYTYNWNNVPAGNYTLSAQATDNHNLTTISSLVNVVVNINNSMGFCGTLNNGDFSYRIDTSQGNVTVVFHPLTPITGCAYVYVYLRVGSTGAYPGYLMTKIGTDFIYTQVIPTGTDISVYFTYQLPAGGENNSMATPVNLIVGSNCIDLPVILSDYKANLLNNGNVAVTWTTTEEVNDNYFIVEKSLDGATFIPLATIIANNLLTGSNYNVLDVNPVIGDNYYRLSQFDKDGKKTVFSVKVVSVNSNAKSSVSIYPNPVNNQKFMLNILNPVSSRVNVQLFGLAGNAIYEGNFILLGNDLKVNLPVKPATGTYILKVNGYSPVKLIIE